MSATAALSAGTVATFAAGGERPLRRADHGSRGRHRSARVVAGLLPARLPRLLHLRAGPQGVHRRAGADDHRRAAAEAASACDKGEGDFFEQAWDAAQHTSVRSTGSRWSSASLSLAVVLVCSAGCPLAARVADRGRCSASLRVAVFDLEAKGVADRRPDRRPACRASGCRTSVASTTTSSWSGPRSGVLLVGFAEGLGAAKTYAAPAGYEVDANRELLGTGRREPRRRARVGHGRQRQPVQDRRQRRGRREVPGVAAWSSRC